MAIETALLWPDSHIPYHDKKAFSLVFQFAEWLRPDEIIIGGDFIDAYPISDHSKDLARKTTFLEEVHDTNIELNRIDNLEKLCKKRIKRWYISGNHEFRLERYFRDRAPALYGMISIPELFKLKERGWGYSPYKAHINFGKMFITHDLEKCGKYAHYQAFADTHANVAIFHTHRLGWAVEGNARGQSHVMCHLGWLGDVNQVDYKHKLRAMKEWALGFGVAYKDTETNHVWLYPVPIVNNRVLFDGKKFS